MTVHELNDLKYLSLIIERILNHLEMKKAYPDFFLPFQNEEGSPVRDVYRRELDNLISEHKRRMNYIESIADPWMKSVFEQRFIYRRTLREIGAEYGTTSGTLKQCIYSYLRRYPEGYVSCRDLAESWGLNINTINNYCRKGLLPGAKKRRGSGSNGSRLWIIPADVKRP